jgi:hypothetical protein
MFIFVVFFWIFPDFVIPIWDFQLCGDKVNRLKQMMENSNCHKRNQSRGLEAAYVIARANCFIRLRIVFGLITYQIAFTF